MANNPHSSTQRVLPPLLSRPPPTARTSGPSLPPPHVPRDILPKQKDPAPVTPIIPVEHQERMDQISRTLGSWEDLAMLAIHNNESVPRTRLRLLQALATPYSPPSASSSTVDNPGLSAAATTSSAPTFQSTDVYRDEHNMSWDDYERRAKDTHAKTEARKKAAAERARKEKERREKERERERERMSAMASGSSSMGRTRGYDVDAEMDLDKDGDEEDAGRRGTKRKAGSGGRKGGGSGGGGSSGTSGRKK